MTLPHVELGNTENDVSGGINTFVKSMLEQRQRQSQLALQEALANAKMLEAQRGPDPFNITSQGPTGELVHGLMSKTTGETRVATGPAARAPESQIPIYTQSASSGVPGVATIPRYQVGQPATSVQLPPGQVGRMEAPQLVPSETNQGPGFTPVQARTGQVGSPINAGSGGLPGAGGQLQPRAQQYEVEKAQFAANMSRSAQAMESAPPEVIANVVGRQNIASVLQTLPVIGATAAEGARSLMAAGLSPEEATWLANFNTFLGFAVPELAGKQMTITEMKQQAAMFAPLPGEPLESQQTKRDNVKFRVQSAIRASGSGWNRLMADPNVAGSLPAEYGGTMQSPAPTNTHSPYGYQKR